MLVKQLKVAVILSWLAGCGFAQAQVSSAARVEKQQQSHQQERERAQREQVEKRPDVRLAPSGAESAQTLPEQETPCFRISRLELVGERAEEFQWVLKDLVRRTDPKSPPEPTGESGRCFGTQGLNLILKRAQEALHLRGFITTQVVASEEQDLRSGIFTMNLRPGVVGAVRAGSSSGPRTFTANALPVHLGEPLNLHDLEQGLENFQRLPSVTADLKIVPAQDDKPGVSDLLVNWDQGRPWRAGLSLDDAGSKATGKYQLGTSLTWDHPFGLNDQIALNLNHDLGGGHTPSPKGTRGGMLAYSVPWGYWLFSTSASTSRYHQTVLGPDQKPPVLYSGTSDTADLKAARALYRSQDRKLSAYARLWSRNAHNYLEDTEANNQLRRTAGWEAGLTHREFIGDNVLDATLAYRRGTGMLSSRRYDEEVFDEGTSRMRIITLDAQWSQPLQLGAYSLRYAASARAQWNRTPLAAPDRFSVGGRYTVRGFDGENLLTAERGWFIRNDLGWQWQPSVEVYAGLDHGQVGGTSSTLLMGTRLTGMVMGLRGVWTAWQQPFSYDIFVGRPLSQPDGMPDKSTNGGFQVSWTY